MFRKNYNGDIKVDASEKLTSLKVCSIDIFVRLDIRSNGLFWRRAKLKLYMTVAKVKSCG
jgi:hypothetical protein